MIAAGGQGTVVRGLNRGKHPGGTVIWLQNSPGWY